MKKHINKPGTDINNQEEIDTDFNKLLRNQSIMIDIIKEINRAGEFKPLFLQILEILLEKLEFDGGGVYLINENERTAELILTRNIPEDIQNYISKLEIDLSPYSKLFIEGNVLYGDIKDSSSHIKNDIKLSVNIPIKSGNKILGALNLISKKKDSVSSDDIDILLSIGIESGIGLERILAHEHIYSEENIRRNEEVHRILLDESPDPIFCFTPEGRYIYVNNAFAKGVRKPVNQIIGNKIWDVFDKDEADKRFAALSTVFQSGNEKVIEVRVPRPDGNRFYITTITPIKDKNGKVITAICSSKEITDRKKAELALMQSEDRLAAFMKFIPLMVMIKDHEHRAIYANDNLRKTFPVDDWMGKKPHELYPSETADFIVEKDNLAFENGFISFEETWTDKEGCKHVIYVHKFRIDISDSKPLIGLILSDITEMKMNEAILKESNEKYKQLSTELKELNSAKDKFISILSHDLRGPFQGFLGITEFLMSELKNIPAAEAESHLKDLNTALHYQFELLEDLLQWSKLQIGRIDFNPSLLSVKSEISKVLMPLYSAINNKQIQINNLVTPDCFVNADAHLLRTLLRNILSNAVKFSFKKGTITINVEEKESFTQFSITDDGVGIHENDIPKLFQLDTHHSSSGTEGEHGSGLGLLLCKEIVEKHGGKIWVNSTVDKGSTFYFTFPKN